MAATSSSSAQAKPSAESQPQPSPESSTPKPCEPTTDVEVIHVPSYSSWFSWEKIHECEIRCVPEFFDENRSPWRNPNTYKYLRNSIIKSFRNKPSTKLTFTEVRRTLIGDVGSVRRVFEFLETWGLINYSPPPHSSKPLKLGSDDKDILKDSSSSSSFFTKAANANADSSAAAASLSRNDSSKKDSSSSSASKRVCGGCKSLCTIACFACDKYDMTLCARCYVRGNYPFGVSSSHFRRVEISEETKPDWTEKDILHLLEAVMHFGDDWKKVSHHVGGKSEKECVAQFLKLPFGEEFLVYPEYGDFVQSGSKQQGDDAASQSPSKRMRLTPLADASNPIMAQAAFLSALAGVEVAEAAAQAAVSALSEVDSRTSKGNLGSHSRLTMKPEADGSSNGNIVIKPLEESYVDANSQLEKEQVDVEGAISEIIHVQMKQIQDKIVHFEELDLQMEKEWQQLEQMKNSLFGDQLTVLFHKNAAPITETSKKQ